MISIKIRSQLQYRLSFVFDVFTSAFLNFTFFISLAMILQRFQGIGGWTLWEVALLYGMIETSFGAMDMLFSGFDPQNFGRHVRLGTFDQMLLRPVNITLQVFSSEFVLRRLGRIFQGALVLFLAIRNLEIAWTPAKLTYLPLVLVSQVAFFGGLFVIGSTITFWTVESIEAINILTYGGVEMTSYPMHIYPDWMIRFFTFIVPAIFINYYPALFLLDKPDPLGFPPFAHLLAPLAGFGILASGLVFWHYGVRHYQSTGT